MRFLWQVSLAFTMKTYGLDSEYRKYSVSMTLCISRTTNPNSCL